MEIPTTDALVGLVAALVAAIIYGVFRLVELRRQLDSENAQRDEDQEDARARFAFEISSRDIQVWRDEAKELRDRVGELQRDVDDARKESEDERRSRRQADIERRHCEEVLRATQINVDRLAEAIRHMGGSLPDLIRVDWPPPPAQV